MTMTAEIAAQRVANGIAMLDANAPNWRTRVDVARLDLDDPFRCVLGQVFGEYYPARRALNMSTVEAAHNGFTIYDGDGEFDVDDPYDLEEWNTLQRAWVAALTPTETTSA